MRTHLRRPPRRPDPESSDFTSAHRRRALRRIARRKGSARRSGLEARHSPCSDRTALKPCLGLSDSDRSDCLWPRSEPLEVAFSPGRQAVVQPRVGESLSRDFQSYAGLSARWRTHPAGIPFPHSRCLLRHPSRRLHQQRHCHGPDACRLV